MDAGTINGLKPIHLTSRVAHSGDTNNIQQNEDTQGNVSIAKGFPSIFSTPREDGGKSVSRKDMNGFLNMMSSLNYYFQYMGRNPWVSGTLYPVGALVWVYDATTGGAEYVCKRQITDTVKETNPASATEYWVKIGTTTGLIVDTSSIKDSVEAIIDTKLTADYLDTKLRYKLVVTGQTPSSYVKNTIYFITDAS